MFETLLRDAWIGGQTAVIGGASYPSPVGPPTNPNDIGATTLEEEAPITFPFTTCCTQCWSRCCFATIRGGGGGGGKG